MSNKTVLITGASTGIGYELAKIFNREGYNLVLVSRNKERLEQVARELDPTDNLIIILPKDLSKANSAKEIFEELQKKNIQIDILINNAGFGTHGQFAKSDLKEQLEMIQLNITTLTSLTGLFLPSMIEKKSGKILNVASIAGFLPGVNMSIYYASKAYVISFSQALSEELKGTGVTISCLCPGPTKTEFQKRANMQRSPLFQLSMMSSERVAQIGFKGLMNGDRLVIAGFKNYLQVLLIRFTPMSIIIKITKWLNS